MLGPTEFFTKSRIAPREFEKKVMDLLSVIAAEGESNDAQTHSAH